MNPFDRIPLAMTILALLPRGAPLPLVGRPSRTDFRPRLGGMPRNAQPFESSTADRCIGADLSKETINANR